MTCTGGWEGKKKLQKPLGDVYPSHPIPSNPSLCSQGALPGAPAGFAGLSNFVEKQNPPGYQEQQMASQAGLLGCGCHILCLMLPGDFTYSSLCENPKFAVAAAFPERPERNLMIQKCS